MFDYLLAGKTMDDFLRNHPTVSRKIVIEGKSYTTEDTRYHYAERRYLTVGHFEGKVVVVVFTEDDDEIRIISFRKATRRERRGLLGQE